MENVKAVFKLFIIPFLIGFYCCNSEKRVLNDADKTQHVVNKYLQTHPATTDTVNRFIPGDTITSLLIGYDTTYVRDTINRRDTVRIREVSYKTVTRVDTLVKTITDNRLLQACQGSLAVSDYDKKQGAIDVKIAKIELKQWKFKFWVLVGAIVAFIVLVFVKRV